MKDLKTVLSLFPEKSFSVILKSKIEDLKKRAATDEQKKQIDELGAVYSQVCDLFDNTIEYLRSTIESHLDYEIEDLESEEIEKVLNEYKQHIQNLINVDIGTPDFETAKSSLSRQMNSISNTYRKNDEKNSSLRRFVLAMIQSIKLKPFMNSGHSEEFEKALDAARKLSKKMDTINSASQIAESLLGKRESLIKEDVKDRIIDLQTKADKHAEKKVWLWFFAGCSLGTIAAIVLVGLIHGFKLYGIVFEPATDVSVGAALLRLGLVSVILYFAFYCIKQFSIHRHLFQLYTFKQIALQVMINLRGESDEVERKFILAKGLEAIFNEPSTGLVQQTSDHSGDYWQSVQRILERLVTKDNHQ